MSVTGCIGEVLAHNTPADIGQIVYDERGMIVREAFGRPLSKLETALCDVVDKARVTFRGPVVVEREGHLVIEGRKPRTMGHGL